MIISASTDGAVANGSSITSYGIGSAGNEGRLIMKLHKENMATVKQQPLRVEYNIHLQTQKKGHKAISHNKKPEKQKKIDKIPRITRLLALAYYFEECLEKCVYADYELVFPHM